jgi:hypothetical protein
MENNTINICCQKENWICKIDAQKLKEMSSALKNHNYDDLHDQPVIILEENQGKYFIYVCASYAIEKVQTSNKDFMGL